MKINMRTEEWSDLLNLATDAADVLDEDHAARMHKLLDKISKQWGVKRVEQLRRFVPAGEALSLGEDR